MAPKKIPLPPAPKPGAKLKGPASYFPSIEKTYGKPMRHWVDLTAKLLEKKAHMEVVAVLKSEHALGHGHANAIVAFIRSARDA